MTLFIIVCIIIAVYVTIAIELINSPVYDENMNVIEDKKETKE